MCSCRSYADHWEPGLQPRHVPWLGIELVTLWFTAHSQSPELHQPGQYFYFLYYIVGHLLGRPILLLNSPMKYKARSSCYYNTIRLDNFAVGLGLQTRISDLFTFIMWMKLFLTCLRSYFLNCIYHIYRTYTITLFSTRLPSHEKM